MDIENSTELQLDVMQWMNEYPEEDRKGAYQDLSNHGCVSGMVSELVWYTQTLAFFEKHSDEINTLIKDFMESVGEKGVIQGFKGYDEDDPLCLYENNRNLLAWFAFEETAYQLYDEEYGG